MKVIPRSSLGTADAKAFNVNPRTFIVGEEVDLPPATVKALTEKYPAIFETEEEVQLRGVAAAPAIRGVPEESPVSDTNADDAIAAIAGMRSKDKLQHIIDNDPRVTVKEAAKKRLASL